LPSWLSKGKEGNGIHTPGVIADHSRVNFSPLSTGKDSLHRPRKLHKEKGRSQATPATFPFVVTQGDITPTPLAENEVRPGAVDNLIKPVEDVSLFETMLPREARLFVLAQLVVVHQEEFESRLKEGRWSVAHASRERWVGKDAGMRELVKLSRVSFV
jgi:F-box/leucine-rich repeat protein 2/20